MRSRGRASSARSRRGARWRRSARSRRSCSRTGSAPVSPPGSFAGTATNVVAVLTQDPYQLVELPRVGFKIADGVARSLGVELDDPQRLQAGLRFVLDEAETDGNTFLPLAELWQRAGRVLGVGELDPLESAVRALFAADEVVVEDDRIYLRRLWELEVSASLRSSPSGSARRRSSCSTDPERPALEISDEQWAVVELVRTRPLVLLTGLPGAGKTHTQRALVAISERARMRVLLCAPTGKAARRMRDLTGHDAMTIHRALGYSPTRGLPSRRGLGRFRTTTT